jgi:holliday junction DNA helicase RuvA
MIGKLRGRLDHRAADHILLDVGGVGYIVFCSERTLAGLPAPGAAVSLFTDLVVREDLMQLFGFPSLLEKEWHRLLMSVQGVGAKASLAIMGAMGAEGVGRAITLGDWKSVTVAKGIGPKIAQRIVLDLKDKAPGVMAMGATLAAATTEGAVVEVSGAAPEGGAPDGAAPQAPQDDFSDQAGALSALSNLGYGAGEAAAAVAQAAGEAPGAGEAGLIRAALKLLAPKG